MGESVGSVGLAEIAPFLAVVALVVCVVAGVLYLAHKIEQRRQGRWRAFCEPRGWSYEPGRNKRVAEQFSFLDQLRHGRNRYAEDIVQGKINGRPFAAFTYHSQTTSQNGDTTHTKHHWLTVVTLRLERDFPELTIGPEHFGKRLLHKFTGGDIDFESHDFSREFEVKSQDRKFAYDFCNPRMIEYLMDCVGTNVEVEGCWMATVGEGKLQPAKIKPAINHLSNVRSLMPNFLFAASKANDQ